ncbi:hypothetical protein DUNSADRAFT_10652 [Dunaliella salina]|uniref:Uncharacterized protein n=1 Tax=Dunaliella salina TaxID=3046 RepID=A0ABQ7GEU8_DUNSA|nr:hypothetical protein DUNSADRAFT_10652 [Dunaliella salina]|eukprot:KAF5833133.1 hypothetical protein DUNSADRAFT_10652 [Dunaliella salina]
MGNASARGFEPISNNNTSEREESSAAPSTASNPASQQQETRQEAQRVQGTPASVTINVNPDPPHWTAQQAQQHGEDGEPGAESREGEIHAPEPTNMDRGAAGGMMDDEHHPLLPSHQQQDPLDTKTAGSSNSSSGSGKTCSNSSPDRGECLQTWRDTQRASLHSQAYFRCEICHYEYQYVRLDSAACIAHPVVVATAFLFMLLVICAFLGIVPIIQACLEAYDIHFTGWLHVLVHLCDGLMVMGLVSVMMVACTSPQLARMQPARLGYNCSLIMCWCRMIGCGQVCGPVWLASLAVLAFLGLINSIPVAFMILYHVTRVLTGATVRMVENVDPNEVRAHKAKAATLSGSSEGQQLQRQQQQQQQQGQQGQQGSSLRDAALAV